MVSHNAASKATSRIEEPIRFATGTDIPQRLQALFPPALADVPPQPLTDTVPDMVREELCAHIRDELRSSPTMSSGGSNGTYYEHLGLHNAIQDGKAELADVLTDLLTGAAPTEAVECLRSGRCHPPLKPDSDTDISPLVSSSAQWRAAMRGWNTMCAAEAVDAVGPQYGVSRPGGPVALRHRVESALALDPSLAVVAIDIANMHGSMGLANIENQVCHRIPGM